MIRLCVMALLMLANLATAQPATARKIAVTWLRQSAFCIVTPSGHVTITDPWLSKNPLTPSAFRDRSVPGANL